MKKTLDTIKNELATYFFGEGPLADEYYENEAISTLAQDACSEWEAASADNMDEVHACDAIIDRAAEKIYKMWNE